MLSVHASTRSVRLRVDSNLERHDAESMTYSLAPFTMTNGYERDQQVKPETALMGHECTDENKLGRGLQVRAFAAFYWHLNGLFNGVAIPVCQRPSLRDADHLPVVCRVATAAVSTQRRLFLWGGPLSQKKRPQCGALTGAVLGGVSTCPDRHAG